MKNFKIIVILLISSIVTLSCNTDDKTLDNVLDNIERGAILRTTNSTNTFNFFDIDDPVFKFDISVEAQDVEDGNLVSEIKFYQSFIDNTDDGTDNSKAEVLVSTTPNSALGTSTNGLPEFNASLLLSEALAINGLSAGQYNGGDQFLYRFELILTDGRVFTNNVGGTVSGGSYFTSPFAYTVGIKCVPVSPFPGDYTLTLKDVYSDTWDGASIDVTIDGVTTSYDMANGLAAVTYDINVPVGTTELDFSYVVPGCCANEHTFVIVGPFGEIAAEEGPSAPTGSVILNICN